MRAWPPLLVVVVVVSASVATAQDQTPPTELDELGEQPAQQPSAQDQIGIGIDILGGLATLGTLASCRTFPYDEGDPVVGNIDIQGRPAEDREELQAFVDGAIVPNKKGRFYSEDNCRQLRATLDALRYRATVREVMKEGKLDLIVVVRSVVLVRKIKIVGNLPFSEFLRFWEGHVFSEEIRRRLFLRPGSILEDEEERRKQQLQDDENRVTQLLARRGFFDARAKLSAEIDPEDQQAVVTVAIDKGTGYSVGEVKVEGNASVPDQHIREALQQRFCLWTLCLWKARFSADRLKEDRQSIIKDYQEEHGFPGARVHVSYDPATSPDRRSKTVRLKVSVEERKRIDVVFQGNEEKSSEELKRRLTFNAQGAYDDFEAAASAEAIRRSYQGSGFFQTNVRWERIRLPGDYEQIVFFIDEGSEQRIERISFRGNKTFTDAELRKHILSEEYPRFDWLPVAGGGYLTDAQLEGDIKGLVQFYQSQGFPQVKVTPQIANADSIFDDMGAIAAQVTTAEPGRRLYLRFDIQEGPRELVKSIEIAGSYSAATDAELAEAIKLRAGKPFTRAALDEDAFELVRALQQKGHLYADVRPERIGQWSDIRVRFLIRQGPLVKMGRVAVRGNFKTKRWVVNDNLRLREGEVLTLDRLDQGQTRLRDTALFSSVRLARLGRTQRVNVVVDVEERYDYFATAEFGIGYATDASGFVSLNYGINNIGGIGLALVGTAEAALKPRLRLEGTLRFPEWVIRKVTGLGLKLDLTGRYRLEETPRFGLLQTIGATATLSRRLAEGVYLSLKYDWSRYARSVDLVRAPGIDIGLEQARITTTTASLGPALIVDRRQPSPFAPSRGYFLSGSLSLAAVALGGNNDFLKLGLAGQVFLPIGRVLISTSLRYDQGFPLGGEVLLPDVERFSAGGDTSVRGFEEDRLKTEIVRTPLGPGGRIDSFTVVPAGGNIRLIHKLDLQLRVWELLAQPVATAVFLDTGMVTNSWNGFELRELRHSLGIALFRWVTAGGSFSFEYAFPLDPQLGDNPLGQFHLNVGFVF